jgi:ATP-dependent RNA helicase DDX19/DBP5
MYYVKRGVRETKLDLLERILERKVSGVTLIFVNTVKFAQVLSGVLTRRGLKCALLAGRNITIDERFLTVQDFKRGFYDIVVSTNLLARGIDNTHITRVINFDIPNHWTTHLVDAETYLHRIGRAGRFSRTGEAITMVGSEAELKMVEEVMRHYGCVIEQLSMEKEAQ